MRKLLAFIFGFVVVVVLIMPGIIVFISGVEGLQNLVLKTKTAPKVEDVMLKLYLHEQDKIISLPLEEYIKGVISAEMPAEFEFAALKAQAVAARTYTVKHMYAFGGNGCTEHPEADMSSDYKMSQAWLGESVLKERWGKNYKKYWDKIEQAVEATRGQILLYDGKPIQAVFHSTSGVKTASALEVWGYDYPYLQSVESKFDEDSPRYHGKKEVPFTEVAAVFGEESSSLPVMQGGGLDKFIQILSYTDSGRVKEIRIGEKVFTGQEVRNVLQLQSDNFTVHSEAEKLVFETIGYGHGVGLSQYGANGMAKAGKSYQEILQHYYTGVELKQVHDLQMK